MPCSRRNLWIFYAPGFGRFISKDPIAGNLENPLSQHPYIYGYDNPVNFTDASGNNAYALFYGLVAASPALIAVGDSITQDIRNGDYASAADKASWFVPGGLGIKVTTKIGLKATLNVLLVLNRIQNNSGKAVKGYKSAVFLNKEGKLPKGGKYIEHDIYPYAGDPKKRGTERIVYDQKTGNAWYTPDHYETFIPIK